MTLAISVENLSKSYRLGQISTGTFTHDLAIWWAMIRGKPNPLLKIGETDHGNRSGEELWALKDVSFTVEQGEVLGIIGRNGAGKSTLLKILSRVTAPTNGRIRVRGLVASLLEVGTGFHPELTGRENIYLNGTILGMTKQEVARKFDEIVDFAEVEKFIDTPVKRYSSGMYVRLAFAVAAHLEPEILVVDEVLAVGDAEFQKKCLGKMGDVAKQGRTVLFVSHNMAAVTSLCSRVIHLDMGSFINHGLPTEVVQHYLSGNVNNASINLADRSDRVGNHLGCITGITITDKNATPIDTVISGQDVTVCVEYKVLIGEAIENGVCILIFKTQLGQPLFSCSTRLFNEYLRLTSLGRLFCRIPRFPLNQGNYYIDVMLKKGTDSRDILDSIENAMQISVIAGDFFDTGRVANSVSSPTLVEHSWSSDEI